MVFILCRKDFVAFSSIGERRVKRVGCLLSMLSENVRV
jgi:hypothetical protein